MITKILVAGIFIGALAYTVVQAINLNSDDTENEEEEDEDEN